MIISINKNTMRIGNQEIPIQAGKEEFLLSLLIHSSFIDDVSIRKTARRITRVFTSMNISNTKDIGTKIYNTLKTVRNNKLMTYAYEVMYYVNSFMKLNRYTVQDRKSYGRSRAYTQPSYSNRFTQPRESNTTSNPYVNNTASPSSIPNKVEYTKPVIDNNAMDMYEDIETPVIVKPKMTMNNSAMALFSNLNKKKK